MLFFLRPKKMIPPGTAGAKAWHGHDCGHPKIAVPSRIGFGLISEKRNLLSGHPSFDLILNAILNGTARFALIASKAEVDR